MNIFNARPEVYLDENLARPIKVYTATNGAEKFVGFTMIQPDPRMQPMEVPFEIEAKDLEEAYSKWDELADAECDRLQKEANEASKEIITPNNDIVI